ncbi:MAG: hypothetical protein UT08_C0020G0014, partial [Candidatus Woesebacteria bacterium GW2011_GWB1_38_8]
MVRQTHEISRHLIQSLEAKALKKRPFSVKIADNLTSLFGSISFLLLNALFFGFWLLANSGKVPGITPFDQFPYPMLTTVVSLEAIILTLIVLMSQNRQSLISSLREEIDIQVNLIAEREITKILQLLKEYLKVRGVKIEDPEMEDMLKEIDESYLERKLEAQLINKPPNI